MTLCAVGVNYSSMTVNGFEPPERDCLRILGVPIDRVTVNETLAQLEYFIASGRPHLVVTADATAVVIAQSSPEFMQLVESADLVTPDGNGILWAGKHKGTRFPERVSGVDIVAHVCELSAQKGYRLYFLGAAPGVAELAAQQLMAKYPGCNVVGTHHGYFGPENDAIVAKEVAATHPDVLFAAMGMPRQEQFIRSTEHIIGAKVSMGVGGSFDVFSGKTKRAPKSFQRLKLEWLWRLVLNPSKIAKVKLLPVFVMMVRREKR